MNRTLNPAHAYGHDMKTTFPPHGRALLHQTPAGAVVIVENGTAVTHLFFSRMAQPEHLEWEETPLLRQTADQLDEYFQGSRRVFDVPLSPQGTEFERTVWKALQAIPYGETRSYGDIGPANRTPISMPGSRTGQQPEPCRHHHPLPPSHRSRRQTDRLCKRPDH